MIAIPPDASYNVQSSFRDVNSTISDLQKQINNLKNAGPSADISDLQKQLSKLALKPTYRTWHDVFGATLPPVDSAANLNIRWNSTNFNWESSADAGTTWVALRENFLGGNVGINSTTTDIGGMGALGLTGLTTVSVVGGNSGNGFGNLELVTGLADATNLSIGQLAFTAAHITRTDKRYAAIAIGSNGATAGDRGGFFGFYTKANAGALAQNLILGTNGNGGFGPGITPNPTVRLEVDGALALRKTDIATLVNGDNNDVNIGTASYLKINTGSITGAFAITGFNGGVDGRILLVHSNVAQTLTLKNQVTSSAANQIKTLTGVDVALRAGGLAFALLIYDATNTRWILAFTG